ncbi:MAG TPA: TVP38/TMEM64 family protein [Anaerolineae bacterium]
MAVATKDRRGQRHYNNFYSWRGDFYPAEITAPTAAGQKELRAARWVVAVLAGLALLIMAWLARDSVATFMTLLSDQEAVSSYVQSYGAWGPLVLGLAQMVQVLVAFIPGHVFVIAAGYVYGFPAGFALNLVCVVAASQLAYSLARWAGRPVVNRLAPPDLLDKWQKIADRQGVMFFTIAFLLPVFPTDAMNFVAGLSGLSPRRFLTANVLGRLPHSIVLTLIGSHGLELTPFAWGILAVLVVAVYVTGRYVIMGIERRHSTGAPAPSNS